MKAKPLYTVLVRLFNKYDVTVGFEESVLDRNHQHYNFEINAAVGQLRQEVSDKEIKPPTPKFDEHLITLNFQEAPVGEVLDAIVKQMENYKWEINNEVINIIPTDGRDPRLVKLMDLNIGEFSLETDEPLELIRPNLMIMPEFKKFLIDNDLGRHSFVTPTILEMRPIGSARKFSNLKFRELLNEITRIKRGGWIVQIKNSDRRKDYVRIFI